MKKVIELRGVTKQFDGETVLDSIDLDIYDNEFLTLLGPSGCGKTTTLRMIGGFETPDQGDILFLGERINDIPPHKRNINTVFQRYALFPHLNVFENVAFPLREQKLPRDEIEQKVNEMLALVKLTGFERRNVTRLSGGQQQRVAIARALVNEPSARAAARRAARRARPEAAQGHAAGAQEHPEGHRHHVRVRHARSGGGAEHVRHHRRHVGRAHPADRHAD